LNHPLPALRHAGGEAERLFDAFEDWYEETPLR
jgi:hypothetical protein